MDMMRETAQRLKMIVDLDLDIAGIPKNVLQMGTGMTEIVKSLINTSAKNLREVSFQVYLHMNCNTIFVKNNYGL